MIASQHANTEKSCSQHIFFLFVVYFFVSQFFQKSAQQLSCLFHFTNQQKAKTNAPFLGDSMRCVFILFEDSQYKLDLPNAIHKPKTLQSKFLAKSWKPTHQVTQTQNQRKLN